MIVDDSGTFQVAVPPGKGHLLLFGPTSDYVLEATSAGMVYSGTPGGRRFYAHKVIAYDVEAYDNTCRPDAATCAGFQPRFSLAKAAGSRLALLKSRCAEPGERR